MLRVEGINTFYGEAHILHNVSLKMEKAETVCLLGRNGAGKTTLLRSILGLTPAKEGRIVFQGEEITRLMTHIIARKGIGWVPDSRRIFPTLTVQRNLEIARRSTAHKEWDLKEVYQHFPVLEQLKNLNGENLSGGQQQMLAIARTLMGNPDLLLLDEPSEGLAPKIVKEVMNIILGLKEKDISILLVEQNSVMALAVSGRSYILDDGRVVYEGTAKELDENKTLKKGIKSQLSG
ncbi:MAG: ABC transporter ATP-binding protein [Thermodesulfobacteriota bacterium]|jgi:branched-chain amino acid transport system ATP-binding protein